MINMECGVHFKTEALEMTYYDCMATCVRLWIHEAMNSIGKETKK